MNADLLARLDDLHHAALEVAEAAMVLGHACQEPRDRMRLYGVAMAFGCAARDVGDLSNALLARAEAAR